MKKYGVGNVDERTMAGGIVRYRARVYVDGKYKTVKVCDTREEAEAALAVAAEDRASGELKLEGDTLRSFGPGFLERREANGGRNTKTDKGRWERHVMSAPFADWPLTKLTPKVIANWIDSLAKRRAADRKGRRTISPQTIRHVVALLRRALQLAMNRGLVSTNAAAGHELPKVRKDLGWTYLMPDEIERLTTCPEIPWDVRALITFAIWTGLRQGELYALELRDVHTDEADPHVIVRWGAPNLPPKNGKVRRIELFGDGLRVAREWIAQLDDYTRDPKNGVSRNPAGIMWPTHRGYRRREGKPPRGWGKSFHLDPTVKLPRGKAKTTAHAKRAMMPSYLARAGLGDPSLRHDKRKVRWHDLRHTCGAALISGWWSAPGERWTLIEVMTQLGHTSTKITERYAHLAPGALANRARDTGKK